MLAQCFQKLGVMGGGVFGLHSAEKDCHRPLTTEKWVAEAAFIHGMREHIIHAIPPGLDELFIVDEIAEPKHSIGQVGGLFVTPPVVAVSVVRDFTSP